MRQFTSVTDRRTLTSYKRDRDVYITYRAKKHKPTKYKATITDIGAYRDPYM